MERIDLFQNLMIMAMADSKLTEEELRMLSGRAVRWGISNEQFEQALEVARKPDACLSIPAGVTERREMLRELLRMMAVDGELADIEKQVFAVAAATANVTGMELDELLDSILNS